MHSDHQPTEAVLDAHIEEAEKALDELRELKQRLGATAVEQLTAVERYDLRVAAAGLVRVGKAIEGATYIKPEPKEIKAPPDTELYDRLLGPEFRPTSLGGYSSRPIVITIENDTTIFAEGRLIEFSREQVFIFNKLLLNRLGVSTKVLASALRHEGEGTPTAHIRVRNMLKGFVFLLGDNIVNQSRLQGRPFGFNANVEFADIREAAGLRPPDQEVSPPPEPEPAEVPPPPPPPASPKPAHALVKKPTPPVPKPEMPEPIVAVFPLPNSGPELTPGGNGNSHDPDATGTEVEPPPLYETQTLAVVRATEGLLKKGWRDANDIAQELGIDVAIVNAFVERNRPKLGKEFAESQKLRRPGQVRYTTRMTEHFSPKFSAWAIASIRQAKAKFEASRNHAH